MANVVICELLCYLQNYYGKVPRSLLCTNVAGFYDETEIVDAKNALFVTVSNMKLVFDDVPRNKQRKAGENKRKLDVDDIVSMFEYLDFKNVSLPDFVAQNLRRLPNVYPTDIDSFKLTETVNDIKAQLADVHSVLKTLSENQASLTDTVSTIANMTAKQPVVPNLVSAISDQPSTSNVASHSYVDLFGSKDDEAKWFVQTTKKHDKKPLRRIVGGNNSTDLKVKAVAGSSEWHLFAGRLDPTTSADDITDMLASKNITVISYKLLRKTETWHQKYAAFRVVVNAADKDNVFNDAVWPLGADVRDWWFTSRQS